MGSFKLLVGATWRQLPLYSWSSAPTISLKQGLLRAQAQQMTANDGLLAPKMEPLAQFWRCYLCQIAIKLS